MSMPPRGGWPPPQPGPHPPNQPQYGPPPGYQPYPGQQPYPPQGQWQQPPPPPQNSGGATKWLLVAIAVLLVIGVTIGATLLFTRDGDKSSTPPKSDVPSDIASANDTGPVSIIMDEPTCKAFNAINNGLADIETNGWGDFRSSLGAGTTWSPEQRVQVQAVADAMRNAADQVVALAEETPHRVVRELYEQFMAYGRAYERSLADYKPADNGLASANVNASGALIGICNAIEYEATRRSVSLPAADPPTQVTPAGDVANPQRFITSNDTFCSTWIDRLDGFNEGTPEWQNRDGSVPASAWSTERRALEKATEPLLSTYADGISAEARKSDNPVLEDFAETASLYIRAYIESIDDYTQADSWLIHTGFRLANLVSGACRAVAG
jgi:hypothetical protein